MAINYQRRLKFYEWTSYILIIGATVLFFMLKKQAAEFPVLDLTLIVLILAIVCRLMMERTRRQAADAELDELREDLRKLTRMYAEERKKNNQNNN